MAATQFRTSVRTCRRQIHRPHYHQFWLHRPQWLLWLLRIIHLQPTRSPLPPPIPAPRSTRPQVLAPPPQPPPADRSFRHRAPVRPHLPLPTGSLSCARVRPFRASWWPAIDCSNGKRKAVWFLRCWCALIRTAFSFNVAISRATVSCSTWVWCATLGPVAMLVNRAMLGNVICFTLDRKTHSSKTNCWRSSTVPTLPTSIIWISLVQVVRRVRYNQLTNKQPNTRPCSAHTHTFCSLSCIIHSIDSIWSFFVCFLFLVKPFFSSFFFRQKGLGGYDHALGSQSARTECIAVHFSEESSH